MRRTTTLFLICCALAPLAGCRRSKDDGGGQAGAGSASAPAASVTSNGAEQPAPTGATSGVAPESSAGQEAEGNDVVDAGADAGRRRRRKLATGEADAGPTVAAPAASASAEPAASARSRPAKGGTMGDDSPYGEAPASAAPIFKKRPMTGEDPWH